MKGFCVIKYQNSQNREDELPVHEGSSYGFNRADYRTCSDCCCAMYITGALEGGGWSVFSVMENTLITFISGRGIVGLILTMFITLNILKVTMTSAADTFYWALKQAFWRCSRRC